ncbi:MAG: TonB-dependent receptor [Deltaproteobacteria bacterium]|nr:TonB-dependent receptor [Deltaproteobacteria bacterium]
MRSWRGLCRLWLVSLLYAVSFSQHSEAQTSGPSPQTLPTVEVRGTTPLTGIPVPREQVPANVQVATGKEIQASGTFTLTDFFSRRFAGVNLTHVQNNPYQPDVSYRGFVSSFLIGTPPGLSVFLDGVRVNEPLADHVNWDLLPVDAIDRIELVPGSHPVYGRNTLGGAIVMQTKRGLTNPGSLLEVWGGSFGRLRTLAQTGGSRGKFDYFFSANRFMEDGFRDFSRSDVGQVFGKVGYVEGKNDLAFSLSYTNNHLTGNGPLAESILKRDRSAVYTHPDKFDPEVWLLNSEYRRDLGGGFTLSTNAFGRFLSIDQFNPGVDEEIQARTWQRGWGGTAQLAYQGKWLNLPVTAAVGLDYNGARLNYRIDEREVDRFAGGEKEPFEAETRIHTQTHGGGAFITLTVEPLERLAITAAGRFDMTSLQIKDRLAGQDNDEADARTTDASGSHRFKRFNPALGATYALTNNLSLYAGYSQSYRAPTAVELTCANPDAPCPVPTAIIDDPPLKAVKGKTWETGVRWSPLSGLRTTLAFFRTELDDDILFRNEPRSQLRGYFQNIDATRRQGIELLLQGAWRKLQWYANYTLTDATFEDDIDLFTFASEDRLARVKKGHRLPLVPAHRIAGGMEFALTPYLRINLDGSYVGSQYLRGDEDNKRKRLSPYFVANAQLTYSAQFFDVFFRLENMFDTNYESYGAFAENRRDGTGLERFLGPGAPLGAFGGVRVKF